MGLGSKEPQRRIYYMSPRMQDKDKKVYPHFKVQVREKDGIIKDLPDESSVSGYLIKISHSEYEYPKQSGIMNPTIQIFLADGEDIFKIETGVQSNATRSIMNTIIGTRDFDVMKIRLFKKKDDKGIEHGQVYIANNDNKTTWKFDYEKDLKPLIEEVPDPKIRGAMIKVYHKVDDLLCQHWLELEPYIADRARKLGYDKPPKSDDNGRPDADEIKNKVDGLNQKDLDGPGADFTPPPPGDDDLPF